MKDRLGDLATCKVFNEVNGVVSAEIIDDNEVEQQLVFDEEGITEDAFKEALSMRKEIALLRIEVKRLGKQNSRLLTSVRRLSSIKRDSNSIARGIKTRGEGLYARLQRMEALCKEMEEKHGAHSAIVRMLRTQYNFITSAFHEAMFEYNEAEMAQRANCKARIQRQAEIMGKEVTGDQVEEMIQTGHWNVFSEDLLSGGRTTRSALSEIENRHKELLELESRIRDVHELFFQLALLVEEQGCMLNNIEANVSATQDYLGRATAQIKKAVRYKKKNPCKKLLCCCFPCCNN